LAKEKGILVRSDEVVRSFGGAVHELSQGYYTAFIVGLHICSAIFKYAP
jgi:hypothetical protein